MKEDKKEDKKIAYIYSEVFVENEIYLIPFDRNCIPMECQLPNE